MREIRTSGSMSGERKRNDGCTAPKSPRLSSTLLELFARPNDHTVAPKCWVSRKNARPNLRRADEVIE
jgi:hypothetical protein